MKKHVLLCILCTTAVFGYAQIFDDLPYSNADMFTYFQQELSSMMKFQAKHNINIPVYASISYEGEIFNYNPEYIYPLYGNFPNYFHYTDDYGYDFYKEPDMKKFIVEGNLLFGYQIKINNTFYFLHLASYGAHNTEDHLDEVEVSYNGAAIKTPAYMSDQTMDGFSAIGAFINTDRLHGGIYFGLGVTPHHTMLIYPDPSSGSSPHIYDTDDDTPGPQLTIKAALVPIVPTKDWAVIGAVLDSIFGFLGLGNALYSVEEEKDSKISALAKALNAALEFSFNRIHFDALSLDAQTIYNRGNFDAAAKTDTYGLKLSGLFSFPLGFSVEGGYKHFYDVLRYVQSDYNDTFYFKGSIYCPLKHASFGVLYRYDAIYQSRITFAVSTNFLSGFYTHNPVDISDKFTDGSHFGLGARFRWGGWNAGKQ